MALIVAVLTLHAVATTVACHTQRGPAIQNATAEYLHVRVRDSDGKVVSDVMLRYDSGIHYMAPLPIGSIEIVNDAGAIVREFSTTDLGLQGQVADHRIQYCIDARGICRMDSTEASQLAMDRYERKEATRASTKPDGRFRLSTDAPPAACPCGAQ